MLDMLQNAKNLIAKGKSLGDPELIQMGMDLLEQYNPISEIEVPQPEPKYHCENCGYEMSIDKVGRKKCPQCKKNKLSLLEIEVKQPEIPHRATPDDFTTQIRTRDPQRDRTRYNEKGEPEGTYAKIEQIGRIVNVWKDDGIEGNDAENERLKANHKISPRNRPPATLVNVVCDSCKKSFNVHPIHVSSRERYLCDRCISRRSRA